MSEFCFEGTASWIGGNESDLAIKDERFITVSPPPEFGGKQGYCVPEEVFAASLASCMNTIFLLIAGNSKLGLKKLETKAAVKMNAEGLEKLIFTHIHFAITVKLEDDNEHERKRAHLIYEKAEQICPLRQSWGEKVQLSFELNFQ
jgi:organic hydroperoxide reductase OsmC/OhrA